MSQIEDATNFARDVLYELLQEAAKHTPLGRLGQAGELISDLSDAIRDEDKTLALASTLLGAAVVAMIGPEAIAGVGAAALLNAVFGEAAAGAILRVGLGLAVQKLFQNDAEFLLRRAMTTVGGRLDTTGIVSLGPNQLGPGTNYLTLSPSGNTFRAVGWGLPGDAQSPAGVLRIRQLGGDNGSGTQDFILLGKDAWSNFTRSNGGFTIHLTNAKTAPDGQLFTSLTTAADTITFQGQDGTSFTQDKVKQLEVVTIGYGGDPGAGGTKLRFGDGANHFKDIVVNSSGSNTVIESNVASLPVILGTGNDTLLHLGAGSTIKAGGTVNGAAGHQTAQYQLSVSNNGLQIGSAATDIISLNGSGFIQNAGTLDGTAGTTSLIVANGVGQTVAGGTGNNIVIAAGTNDTLTASQSGQKLVALGQSNDVLNGQTADKSGIDHLIAVAGKVVGGNVSNAGNDTLNAGVGNNIMIGDGVNTTFNINQLTNPNAIDVVWGQGGRDAIDITGVAQVMVVNAPNATLASVKNLDVQKLFQEVKGFTANHLALANNVPPFAGQRTVIVINPTPTEQLTIDGIKVTGDVANYTAGNFAGTFDNSFGQGSVNQNFVALPDGTLGHESWIVGLASEDFGITESNTDAGGFVTNGTPTFNLMQYQVQASANAGGGAGGGTDPAVVDQSNVYLGDVSDTLVSITAASAFGFNDTLIAANGADTLTASGYQDTLIGNAGGSTLVNSGGYGTVAAYTINSVTVDLNAHTARANGSALNDTLIGITAVAALGTDDALIGSNGVSTLTALAAGNTLIGGTGTTTLLGNANGSTLVAGSGSALAAYSASNVAVNLATGRATVAGSGVSDTLVGIHNVTINGMHSTLTGGTGGDTLTAGGLYELLLAGSGFESLTTYGSSNTLIGGSSNDILTSNGYQNTLMAGTGANVLQSTGYGDTLIGNGLGSSLLGRVGNGAIAAYTIDNVLVDLGSNRATVSGSGVSDLLENIIVAEALGHHDTLLGNSGDTTLIAAGSADTLLGGSGTTTLQSNAAGNMLTVGTGQAIATYAIDNVIVDLAAGSASVSGSSVHDTLVGITKATVSGTVALLVARASCSQQWNGI